MIHIRVNIGVQMNNEDARDRSEIMWQLHTLGQKLDPHYRIEHVRITHSSGEEHEQYVIKYNFKNKSRKV